MVRLAASAGCSRAMHCAADAVAAAIPNDASGRAQRVFPVSVIDLILTGELASRSR
jgi:hypothetical protein